MYIFKLSYGTVVNQVVEPSYGDDFEKQYTEDDISFGKRTLIDSVLTFFGNDYDTIIAQPYNTVFYVQISKDYTYNYFNGLFKLQECEIDRDRRLIKVKMTSNDDYKKISEIYNTEVTVSELGIQKSRFGYKKYELIQIYVNDYISGDSYVTNYCGGTYWKQFCNPVPMSWNGTLVDFYGGDDAGIGIGNTYSFIFIDFAGVEGGLWRYGEPYSYGYDISYIHENNNFVMGKSLSGNSYWEIKRLSDNIVYWVSDSLSYQDDENNGNNILNHTFSAVYDDRTFKVTEEKIVHLRSLADEQMVNANNTVHNENTQIFAQNEQYTKITSPNNFFLLNIDIQGYSKTQTTATKYGLNPDRLYFSKLQSNTAYKYEQIGTSFLGNFSLWFRDSAIAQDTIVNSPSGIVPATSMYNYGYTLGHLINGILSHFNINKQYSSTFFSTGLNPISAQLNRILIFTDITNITGKYPNNNSSATNDKISLSQLFRFLRVFNIGWDLIDNKFRVEHIYFYKNGQSYTNSPQISIDLTDKLNTHNLKSWSKGVNKYNFNYEDEYRYTEFEMGQSSDFFSNSKITALVDNENTKKEQFDDFFTDINYITAMSDEVKNYNDSWLFSMVDSDYNMTTRVFTDYKDTVVTIQNSSAALPYISRFYQGYYYSVDTVDIDGYTKNVQGSYRPIIQEVSYPLKPNENDPNPLKLIKTDLGNGYVRKIVVNLNKSYCKIELEHEYSVD